MRAGNPKFTSSAPSSSAGTLISMGVWREFLNWSRRGLNPRPPACYLGRTTRRKVHEPMGAAQVTAFADLSQALAITRIFERGIAVQRAENRTYGFRQTPLCMMSDGSADDGCRTVRSSKSRSWPVFARPVRPGTTADPNRATTHIAHPAPASIRFSPPPPPRRCSPKRTQQLGGRRPDAAHHPAPPPLLN